MYDERSMVTPLSVLLALSIRPDLPIFCAIIAAVLEQLDSHVHH